MESETLTAESFWLSLWIIDLGTLSKKDEAENSKKISGRLKMNTLDWVPSLS